MVKFQIPNVKLRLKLHANSIMFLLQFWTIVLDSVNKLSEYLQNNSTDIKTAESLIECCYCGILEMRNDVTFDNFERNAIELSKKCEGPEMFVEKRPHRLTRRNFLMNKLVIQLLTKRG